MLAMTLDRASAQADLYCSGEIETVKVAVEGTDVVAPDAVVEPTMGEGGSEPVSESEAEPDVTSHPLTDMFGAQVWPCKNFPPFPP